MCKMAAGLLVGVFVGALAYEVVRKAEFVRRTARKVSQGVRVARDAFDAGYKSTVAPQEAPAAGAGAA